MKRRSIFYLLLAWLAAGPCFSQQYGKPKIYNHNDGDTVKSKLHINVSFEKDVKTIIEISESSSFDRVDDLYLVEEGTYNLPVNIPVPNKLYYFKVRIVGARGFSPWSDPVSLYIRCSMDRVFSGGTGNYVKVDWTATNVDTYLVEMDTLPSFNSPGFEQKYVTGLSYKKETTTLGSRFYYRVGAVAQGKICSWVQGVWDGYHKPVWGSFNRKEYTDRSPRIRIPGIFGGRQHVQLFGDSDHTQLLLDTILSSTLYFEYDKYSFNSPYYLRMRWIQGKKVSKWSNSISYSCIGPLLKIDDNAALMRDQRMRAYFEWNDETLEVQVSNDPMFQEKHIVYNGRSEYFNLRTPYSNLQQYVRLRAYVSGDTSEWTTYRVTIWPIVRRIMLDEQDISNLRQNGDVYPGAILSFPDDTLLQQIELKLSEDERFNSIIMSDSFSSNKIQLPIMSFGRRFYLKYRITDANGIREPWSDASSQFMVVEKAVGEAVSFGNKSTFHTLRVESGSYTNYLYEYRLSGEHNFNRDTFYRDTVLTSDSLGVQLPFLKPVWWQARLISPIDTSGWSKPWALDSYIYPYHLVPKRGDVVDHESVEFSWVDDSRVELKYEVHLDTVQLALSKSVPFEMSNRQTMELRPARRYYWRVRAISSIDTSDWSETMRFETAWGIGVGAGISQRTGLYPNPAQSGNSVRWDNQEPGSDLFIFNSEGKLVWQHANAVSGAITIKTLSPGIYMVKIEEPNGTAYWQRLCIVP